MGQDSGNGESIAIRTVVCEQAAQDAIDGCASVFKRGQEVCDALMDLIMRRPTFGELLPETSPPEFLIRSDVSPDPDIPVVTMHYRLEPDETIVLLKARYQNA